MTQEILIPCNFDNTSYKTKPNAEAVRKIKMNLGKGYAELTLQKVVEKLTSGCSMGFFGLEGMSAKTFKCARQFGIDFDNENLNEKGIEKRNHNLKKENIDNQLEINASDFMQTISYDEVVKKLAENGLYSSYTIKTTSFGKVCKIRNIPLEKFKVFVVTDEIITCPKEAEKCILALLHLFPQADQSGKDLARFTFGTSNGLLGSVVEITNKKQILLDIFDTIPQEQKPIEKKPYVPKKQSANYTLQSLYDNFPLLDYLKSKFPHCKVKRQSGNWSFTPHPTTGSEDSTGFRVYDDNTFCDFSNGNVNGNIFNFLVEYEDYTEQQARNKVKELSGIDISKELEDWKLQQKENRMKEKQVKNEKIKNIQENFVFDIEQLEFPFPDEAYLFVINQENESNRVKLKQALSAKAKSQGFFREFSELYKAFVKENPKQKEVLNNVTAFDIDNELYCGHWIADKQGIRTLGPYGELFASNTAIYPLKILENIQTKEEKVKIAFFDKTHWSELFVDKEMLLVSSKLTGLTKYGVLVTSEWSRNLTNYFAQVFAKNDFEKFPSTSKMGWAENYKAFLPLTESTLELDVHIGFSALLNSLKPKGNQEEYISFIKKILLSDRLEPKIALYASLSSVLIEPLGLLSFIVHIYGQAGIGKTLITKMCAGVWGSPVENGFLQDPKNSKTSFEILLNLLHSLPFIADDINKISSDPFFKPSDLIYLLGGGTGKGRGTVEMTLRGTGTWRNISILNGERALTSDTSHGGELLRTIELQLEPKVIFEDGSGTADFLHNNYGFLGKMFVEYIIKYEQIHQAKDQKKYFAEEIKKKYGNKKEGKQIESAGVLYAAQDILCGMLGVERTVSIEEFSTLIKDVDMVLDTKRAYTIICDLLIQSSSSFISKNKVLMEGEKYPTNLYGWNDGDDYYILGNYFTTLCKQVNIDKKLLVEWCIQNEFLHAEKGRKDGTNKFYIQEQQQYKRLYKLTINKEE